MSGVHHTGKWCKHCRKVDHNTSECWSTHAVEPFVDAPEPQGGWLGVMKGSLAAHKKLYEAAAGLKESA